MPINKKKMSALKKEYGEKKGESVYYALENKAKTPMKKMDKKHEKKESKSHEKKEKKPKY